MFQFSKKRNTQRVCMDYASTTPLSKDVFKKMKPFLSDDFYNPSALYVEGVTNKNILKEYRIKAARELKVRDSEIYFTSGGTESNNLAILGVIKNLKTKDFNPHIIVTTIEHPAVLEVAKDLEKEGVEVDYLSVDEKGIVNLDHLKNLLKENTVLVSVIYANNEIGTIQPLHAISNILKEYKKELNREVTNFPFLHSDAAQAPNYLDVNCNRLGVDLLSIDGSKIYGPKGSGFLMVKHYVDIKPIMFGGGQENGLRPGTENMPGIVGLVESLVEASEMREQEKERISKLKNKFIKGLEEIFLDLIINGHLEKRLPNNINICIPGINAEFEVIRLDQKGLMCAYTTACKTLGEESKSYVVESLGKNDCAKSSLRFTLGRFTTDSDIEKALKILKNNFKNH